jgi:hypothetical protein
VTDAVGERRRVDVCPVDSIDRASRMPGADPEVED